MHVVAFGQNTHWVNQGFCRKSYFLNLIEKVKYKIIRLFEKVKVKAVLKLVPFCRLSAIAMAVNAKF